MIIICEWQEDSTEIFSIWCNLIPTVPSVASHLCRMWNPIMRCSTRIWFCCQTLLDVTRALHGAVTLLSCLGCMCSSLGPCCLTLHHTLTHFFPSRHIFSLWLHRGLNHLNWSYVNTGFRIERISAIYLSCT